MSHLSCPHLFGLRSRLCSSRSKSAIPLGLATVSFTPRKRENYPAGFKIASKSARLRSQVFEGARGDARSRRERIEGRRDGWRGIQRGSGIYAHAREGGSPRFHGGVGGRWASMTLAAEGVDVWQRPAEPGLVGSRCRRSSASEDVVGCPVAFAGLALTESAALTARARF